MNLDSENSIQPGWFVDSCKRRVGDDPSTRFWEHKWVGAVRDVFLWLMRIETFIHSIEREGSDLLLDVSSFKNFWKSRIPSKVLAFSGKLLQDRLPTCEQLLKRGITNINMSNSCVFCKEERESAQHLFCIMQGYLWGVEESVWLVGYPSYFFLMIFMVCIISWVIAFKGGWTDYINTFFGILPAGVYGPTRTQLFLETERQIRYSFDFLAQINTVSLKWFLYKSGHTTGFFYSFWCTDPREFLIAR